MIEFLRSGKPTRTNKKCEKCTEQCKQHAEIRIIRCPSYKAGGAPSLEK